MARPQDGRSRPRAGADRGETFFDPAQSCEPCTNDELVVEALALEPIGARFGVRMGMLEGGETTNGGMLRAGLIDEVSLLAVPLADGRVETPSLFDVEGDGGVLRLRYLVAGGHT